MPAATVLSAELEAVILEILDGPDVRQVIGRPVPITDAAARNRLERLIRLAMITALEYAPAAPLEVLRESTVRIAGWLAGVPAHVTMKDVKSPDGTNLQHDFAAQGSANALRKSGAAPLLAPYRALRAFEGF